RCRRFRCRLAEIQCGKFAIEVTVYHKTSATDIACVGINHRQCKLHSHRRIHRISTIFKHLQAYCRRLRMCGYHRRMFVEWRSAPLACRVTGCSRGTDESDDQALCPEKAFTLCITHGL